MKLIDDEIAKYERQAREAHADADQTRDGFRRDFARQCEAKARQWRELRDSLPAGVPDPSDAFYADLYKKSAPMWHRLHDLAVSKGYDHVRFAIECAPVYKCDCMGARKVAIDMAGNTIPCECVAAAPTVKAEQVDCLYCQGHGEVTRISGQTAESYSEHNEECPECKGTGLAPSLPAAGSAVEEVEVVGYRFFHVDHGYIFRRTHIYEGNPSLEGHSLMTVAQHERIVAVLRAQIAERDASIEEWSGTAVQNGMEVDRLSAALSAQTAPQGLRIVLDGPCGPEAGRFVEVENAAGRSVNAGEWRERADGLWELVLHAAQGGE